MDKNGAKEQLTSFRFIRTSATKKLSDSSVRDPSTKFKKEKVEYVTEFNRYKYMNSYSGKKPTMKHVIPCQLNDWKLGQDYNSRSCENIKHITKRNVKNVGLSEKIDPSGQQITQSPKKFGLKIKHNVYKTNKNSPTIAFGRNQEKEELIFSEDIKSRAEMPSIKDYATIPVEGFGMAMLRGMGFHYDEGADTCIEPRIRPKGLGLGAAIPKNERSHCQIIDDSLELVKDAFVLAKPNSHKDYKEKSDPVYGKIEGLDEENARVFVKMALGGKVLSVPENKIRIVRKSEYEKFSNLINKHEHDKHARKTFL